LTYPGMINVNNGTSGLFSLYLERNVFVGQLSALIDGLTQLWMSQNAGILPGVLLIQVQNQVQYMCSGG